MHEDVALAVRCAPSVPATVHLGQLERRGPPRLLVQWRLNVVVGVEQHGRRGRVGGRPRAVDGVASVGSLLEAEVDEADLGERVHQPSGRPGALLRRELPGVRNRLDCDQLGQVGAGLRHQPGDPLAQLHPGHSLDHVVQLQVIGELRELGQLLRAVGLDDRELTLDHPVVGDDRPDAGPGGAVSELPVQDSLLQSTVRDPADRPAVVAQHPDHLVLRRRRQTGLVD